MSVFDSIINRAKTGEIKAEENTPDGLRNLLKLGIVEFEFTKKDGKTVRNAIGTLDLDKVSEVGGKLPEGGDFIPRPRGYLPYFDLESNEFRCYHPDRFNRIIRTYTLEDAIEEVNRRAEERRNMADKGYSPVEK